jgi:hypothetical protein
MRWWRTGSASDNNALDSIASDSKDAVRTRTAHYLAILLILMVTSGTSCPRAFQTVQPPPVVFHAEPTLDDVMRVVNQNRALIHSIFSTRATLNGTGFPALKANLAIGSPRHVRMRAGLGVAGSELDLGSNDQVFWVWIKRSQPRALYYGQHNQFASSDAPQVFPVQPEWLVEAIGLTGLDPQGRHQGPFRRPDGRLEVRTQVPSSTGDITKALVIDQKTGWIVEQHLYSQSGQLVASAYNRNHKKDELTGAVLARRTDMYWPAASLKLTLELKDVQINPGELGAELWQKPEFPGYPNVDVTQQAATAGTPFQASVPPSPFQPYTPQSRVGQRRIPGGVSAPRPQM